MFNMREQRMRCFKLNIPTTSSFGELEGYGMERISLKRTTLNILKKLFFYINKSNRAVEYNSH